MFIPKKSIKNRRIKDVYLALEENRRLLEKEILLLDLGRFST